MDLDQVTRLCEDEARERASDLTMLAILHAWRGDGAKAIEFCSRLQTAAPPTIAPIPEWEEAMRAFGRELVSAIGRGEERVFLRSKAEASPIKY